MSRPRDDFAVLIASAGPVDTDQARQLLAERGIPSLVHGPDFDVAELGTAVHQTVRGADLLVPCEALERALAVLREAWGEDRVAELRR